MTTTTAAVPAAVRTIDRELAVTLAYAYRAEQERDEDRQVAARLALRALLDVHIADPAARARIDELVSEIHVSSWAIGTAFARSVGYNQTISRTVFATPVPPLPPVVPRALDEQTRHDPDAI
jgi:hypothetical protein